jgi:hypothetical protein
LGVRPKLTYDVRSQATSTIYCPDTIPTFHGGRESTLSDVSPEIRKIAREVREAVAQVAVEAQAIERRSVDPTGLPELARLVALTASNLAILAWTVEGQPEWQESGGRKLGVHPSPVRIAGIE